VTRRRIYLLRHADVAYFDAEGRPVRPDAVSLTPVGIEQAREAAAILERVSFDRVVTSGLRRTLETAAIVAPGSEPEAWPELREIEPGGFGAVPEDEVEGVVLNAFRGAVPLDRQFLGGETIGSLLERVLPALEQVLADPAWDTLLAVLHGGVNRAILSYALTGQRVFFGGLEQAPCCINILDVGEDWVVRAVGLTPYDLVHSETRSTTMELLYEQYRRP